MPENDNKAVQLLRKAIEGGNYVAMGNLGLMYFNGEGVPQSYAQSYAWYSTAAAAGDHYSKGDQGQP